MGWIRYTYLGGRGSKLTAPAFGWELSRFANGFNPTPKLYLCATPSLSALVMDNAYSTTEAQYTYPGSSYSDSSVFIASNNHASADKTLSIGENIAFVDGHGEWVTKPFLRSKRYRGNAGDLYW